MPNILFPFRSFKYTSSVNQKTYSLKISNWNLKSIKSLNWNLIEKNLKSFDLSSLIADNVFSFNASDVQIQGNFIRRQTWWHVILGRTNLLKLRANDICWNDREFFRNSFRNINLIKNWKWTAITKVVIFRWGTFCIVPFDALSERFHFAYMTWLKHTVEP